MPKRPGEPLRKVTLNLYDADVEGLAKRYGFGWSEHVREMVRDHLRSKPVRYKGTMIRVYEDGTLTEELPDNGN